jgi:adenylosuccinate synthase
MLQVDVIVGVQHGDEGKGKVTHSLLSNGDYTHCLRYNGGCNAGHTIYHEGQKFVTHHIPAGVFFGIKSIIGSGCVVDINKFLHEIKILKEGGIDVQDKIFIAKNAHIIREKHLWTDSGETAIGTTRTGNGPCYSEKYSRDGLRAGDVAELAPFLIDLHEEFYFNNPNAVVLCEGAQGFGLDIDWGDYPYVTSSHCTTAGALLNGFPPQSIRKIYGVAKAYETYVGAKEFQPAGRTFELIQRVGNEFGATTGRPRQCNWINLFEVNRAIAMNGVTDLIINKIDVLEEVDRWAAYVGRDPKGGSMTFQNKEQFCDYIQYYFKDTNIIFSGNPERI